MHCLLMLARTHACRLRMNSAHYDKMKELFRRACVQGSSGRGALPPAGWTGDFHDSLFACLMRYEALQVR